MTADQPQGDTRRERILRRLALALYLTYMASNWHRNGLPLERIQVLAWMGGAMLIAVVGRSGFRLWRLLIDWVPMGLLLAVYDRTRGLADELGMPIQRESVIGVERTLFGSPVPSVVWQARFLRLDQSPAWWEVAVAVCYFSHFIASFALLAVLWVRKRDDFLAFRRRFGLLTVIGLTGYILLPTAPPWMTSKEGLIGEVQRSGLRGFRIVGWHTSDVLLTYGAKYANRVAAMPSLHGGWSMLIALFLTRYLPRWSWPILFAYPALMLFTLVVGGEHYVVDVLAGFACAGFTMVVVAWLERRFAGYDWRQRAGRATSVDNS